LIVDRISERAKIRKDDKKTTYLSIYDVLEKITSEVISNDKELVNDITLGNAPESALENKIIKYINQYNFKVANKKRNELIKDIMDNIFGYGIVQKYLDINDCNGVFINGPDNIWIQVKNKRERVNDSFGTISNLTSFIRSINAKLGGEINENRPLAKFHDAENKLRIVACISPVAHLSPSVVFRKHRKDNFKLSDLIEIGMLPKELADELKRYNFAGANIVICGKGGAGKTTLARALTEELPETERILLMEEHPEWFLKHPGALQRLVKRNEKGHVTGLTELTDMGLLETIDRYIFGEIRGSEAMPFFKGALSGNTTMSTTHSTSAREVIDMLVINMKMSGTDIPTNVLREILFKSINIIIYMDRFTVREVVEVVFEDENNRFNDLWTFDVIRKETTFIEGNHRKVGIIKSKDMFNKLYDANLIRKEEFECFGYGS